MDAPATPAAKAAVADRIREQATSRATPAYRPDIDGLRALAVVPVVLFHVGFAPFSGGFVGVDVFFVISGFLITGILKRELDGGGFSLIGFYARRARRIVPALLVMSAGVAWGAYLWLPPRELISVADALAFVGLFGSNIYFFLHAGYWDAAARDHPLLHTWSLGVEEQFYIVFPLLLAALHRWMRAPRRVVAGLGLASLGASIWAAAYAPEAGFYLIPFRAFELIMGALIAYGAVAPPGARWLRELLGAAGVALIALAVFGFSQATPFPGVAALVPCLGAGMILLAGAGGPSLAAQLLSAPPVRFVGLVSYSLYLWHWPLIVFSQIALGRPFRLEERLLLCAAAFALAVLSWAVVERPFRRRGGRFPATPVAFGLAAAGIVLGLFAAQEATANHGWSNRLPPDLAQIEAARPEHTANDPCFLSKDQLPPTWGGEACVIAGAQPQRVLWWGDSFAAQYVQALTQDRAQLPFSVVQYNYAGCPPVLGFNPVIAPHCADFNARAFDVIAANHIGVVVLIGRWEAAERRGLSLVGLTRTVAALQARGLKVVVVGQSPVFVADAVKILAWRRLRGADPDPMEEVAFDASLNPALRAAAGSATFIDPMAGLCQGRSCRLGDGRQAFFIDDGHMSLAGALKTLPWLVAPIAQVAAAPPLSPKGQPR
ncbi:MAG TPA: acyltransferase family protein [Caulobacteraceae bacterium]|jgi:peptidoglycan/LPS O-acetylase OafA/YrhL|nr:acyltransferase family protein [Caulobacteraceae bacterium]